MRCAIHPGVETNLSCGKCGQPICPKCMVTTPVGARCPKCARLKRPPTYDLSLKWYLRAIGAGAGTALVVGLLWFLLSAVIPFFFANLLLAGGSGYVIGEVTSRAANRKRSLGLAIISSLAFLLSYLVSLFVISLSAGIPFWLVFRFSFGLYTLLALGLGVFLAQNRLR